MQAVDAVADHQTASGIPVTKVGLLDLADSGAIYEQFWIEKMPALKLVHPKLDIMYDYVGDSNNGGLCCFDDSCGEADLSRRCLEPLDENLKEFVLDLDHVKPSCRGREKFIPHKRHPVYDSFFLAAPRVLWKHLVKAWGLPLMLSCVGVLVVFWILITCALSSSWKKMKTP